MVCSQALVYELVSLARNDRVIATMPAYVIYAPKRCRYSRELFLYTIPRVPDIAKVQPVELHMGETSSHRSGTPP